MLLSELSNLIRNHFRLKVSIEVGVSDILRCINYVPKYLVLKSLNGVSVALFRAFPQLYAVHPHSYMPYIHTAVCRTSTQLYAVGPHSCMP